MDWQTQVISFTIRADVASEHVTTKLHGCPCVYMSELLDRDISRCNGYIYQYLSCLALLYFDTVGWAAGRASGL